MIHKSYVNAADGWTLSRSWFQLCPLVWPIFLNLNRLLMNVSWPTLVKNVFPLYGLHLNRSSRKWVSRWLIDGVAKSWIRDGHATLKLPLLVVTTCLLVWSHTGLRLDSALRQPDSVDILRHLRVGIELVGVLLYMTCESLASRLLCPDFHAQHVLLDLLESPLISTPLRMLVVGALDRSLSIGVIGFEAFVSSQEPEKGDREDVVEGISTPYQRTVLFLTNNKASFILLHLNCKQNKYEDELNPNRTWLIMNNLTFHLVRSGGSGMQPPPSKGAILRYAHAIQWIYGAVSSL